MKKKAVDVLKALWCVTYLYLKHVNSALEDDLLEVTEKEVAVSLLEEEKRKIAVLSEKIDLVCYMYNWNLCEVEELHEKGSRQELMDLGSLSLSDPLKMWGVWVV